MPGRDSRDEDFDRELRSHLEAESLEQHDAGLSPTDARDAARRAFGNSALIKEDVHAVWGWATLEQVVQDTRYTLRAMRKSLTFTAVAMLSLALGIGATTSVFSVVNAVLFRPLPVAEPERLVIVQPELRSKRFVLFNPLFEEIRSGQQALSGMFAVSDEAFLKVAIGNAPPSFLRGSLVSGTYFRVLGIAPARGRLFSDGDDTQAAPCAAVVSHRFWADRLQSDPAVIGRPLTVRETACTIVGVAPASFSGHHAGFESDLWLPIGPLTAPRLLASRTMAFFSGVMGRLQPGVTPTQAAAELTAVYQRAMAASPQGSPHPNEQPPKPADFRVSLAPGAQGLDTVRRAFEQPLLLALAVVAVVLLIAAFNVANLLLARGAARRAEFSTRAALGASRQRLVRQLTIEGAMLAVSGALIGCALAYLATPALASVVSLPYRPLALNTAPDIRVLAAALATTLFTALLAGVVPAFRLSREGVQSGIAGAGRTTSSRSGQRLTRTLVAAQLALSLLLITCAALLLRSILHVMAVDPGFNTRNVVLMDVRDTEPAARFGETDPATVKSIRAARYQSLAQRLNAIPEVESAGLSWLGLFGGSYVGVNVHNVLRPEDRRFTLTDYVTPGYFDAVGMQLVRGRLFTEADREGSQRVAVVNQAFARERIPDGQQAIGNNFVLSYGTDARPFTIVGIVRDAKYNDLRERKTEPMMWIPITQVTEKFSSISLRVRPGTETSVTRQARATLTAASPHFMVQRVTTLRAKVDQATSRERLLLTLASSFGGIALLLAAVGLYGTLAYAVARRTREIGVRLALGAQRSAVLRLVLGESLVLVAAGMLVGIPLSLGAGAAMRSFLFGVTAYDVPTLIAAAAVLAIVALIAALVPARRASRVDPILALKYE